jgi:multiple sugar transport system ATP-binding protein
MTLSDLIAVMRDGKLVQFGSQHEIYRRPANTYVATFVGKPKMSLLEGDLEHHDGSVDFVGPNLRIPLGSPASIGLADGDHRRVALGIRAEDVRIQLDGAPDTPRTFGAEVGLMEPIGSDTFVELAVGASTIVARAAPDIDVALGQTVRADMAPGRIHLFDLGSGERLVA